MSTTAEILALAKQYHQAGNLRHAEQLYLQVIDAEPDHAEALHLLGILASQGGRYEQAIEFIEQALHVTPAVAIYHNNLGFALQALERLEEAATHYLRAIELQPDYAVAHCNLGAVLESQGQSQEAESHLRQALRLRPDYPQAHTLLGNTLASQGRLEDAIVCHHQALGLAPNFVDALVNLGFALNALGELDQAIACYLHALRLNTDSVPAHASLAIAFTKQGKHGEAIASYREAIRRQPDMARFHHDLGIVLAEQGKLEEAIASFRRVLQLAPDNPAVVAALVHQLQQICLWDEIKLLALQVIDAIEKDAICPIGNAVLPFVMLGLPIPTTAQQQFSCARQWVARQLPQRNVDAVLPPISRRCQSSKLRIGYLSADFNDHAVAHLVAELIEKHDRGQFELVGYSHGTDDRSPMRKRLSRAFDRFVELTQITDLNAARRIGSDEVDVLVDLMGYTRGCRTEILAFRPAPIQVNFLGYPGTTGAKFLDYVLVDEFVVPPDQQRFFSERLVHLPGCYQVNDSRREIAVETPSRTKHGLPQSGFIFCCFNNTFKITPDIFDVWMTLLREVPGSVFWLLEGNRYAPGNLRREAQLRGISADRLLFAPRLPAADHLARHRRADLFLDTMPYNAHTTASEALWAGCLVLTMAGQTFPSRVAGSILRTLGLPELVTANLQEYKDMALRLARDPVLLAELRDRLEANRKTSPLFSGEQFARNVEQAYSKMWEIYLAGEPPRGFAVKTPD